MTDILKQSIINAKTSEEAMSIVMAHKDEITPDELVSIVMSIKDSEYVITAGKICSNCLSILYEKSDKCSNCGCDKLVPLMRKD